MRDYKQMKEIEELKKAQENSEQETPESDSSSDSESSRYSHRGPGFSGWISYVWEYYKWPILIGLILVIGLSIGIGQATSNSNPDLSITYVGPFYISVENQQELKDSIALLSGDCNGDYNDDGEFRLSFLDLTVTFVKDAAQVTYTYDEQNSAYTRFQTELRAGDTLLYFLEPNYYAEAKSEGILQPIKEITEDASVSFDGFGIHLGDLAIYQLPGFCRMPASTVICLRQSPAADAISYGRKTENWEYHRSLMQAMIKYKGENNPSLPSGNPDLTVLYVGPSYIYRYMENAFLASAGSFCADINSDKVCVWSLNKQQVTGFDANDSNTKNAKIELVTGSDFILLLSEQAYTYALDHNLLEELPEEAKDIVSDVNNYGIRLSSLPIYETEAFSGFPGETILCLRKNPDSETESFGRSKAHFESAREAFLKMANYKK